MSLLACLNQFILFVDYQFILYGKKKLRQEENRPNSLTATPLQHEESLVNMKLETFQNAQNSPYSDFVCHSFRACRTLFRILN